MIKAAEHQQGLLGVNVLRGTDEVAAQVTVQERAGRSESFRKWSGRIRILCCAWASWLSDISEPLLKMISEQRKSADVLAASRVAGLPESEELCGFVSNLQAGSLTVLAGPG